MRHGSLRARSLLLAAGIAGLAAYVSLVPFEFARPESGISLIEHVRRSIELGASVGEGALQLRSRANLLANVVMFVPFGLFAAAGLVDDRSAVGRWLGALVAIVLASVTVSVAIEVAQAFVPGRTPSIADVVAQTIGTVVGYLGWRVVAGEVRAWWTRETAFVPGGVQLWLAVYTVGRLLVMLWPLDVTVDLGILAGRVRGGQVVLNPLASPALAWSALPSVITDVLLAVPVGVLAVMVGLPAGQRRRAGAAVALGALLFCAAELAQVFIQSRTADVVDIAASVFGLTAGVLLAHRGLVARSEVPGSSQAAPQTTLLAAGLGAMAVLYVIYNWTPFDFTLSRELVASKVGRLWAVPFAGYYQNPEFKALGDLAVKLSLSVPLGVLLQLLVRPDRSPGRRLLTIALLGAAAVFFGVVEVGQVLLPTRYPDNSDVLIALAGTWAGMQVARRVAGAWPTVLIGP